MFSSFSAFLHNFLLLGSSGYWNTEPSLTKRGLKPLPPPEIIPREVFFKDADRSSAKLSPNGQSVSFVAPWNGTKNVWIIETKDLLNRQNASAEFGEPITFDQDRGIFSYSWTLMENTLIYSQDNDGDENYKLYKVNALTKETTVLYESPGVRTKVMASSRKYPNRLIVGLNNRTAALHDLYTLDIETGDLDLLLINNGFVSYIFDHDLNIRMAKNLDVDGSSLYFVPTFPDEILNVHSNWTLYRKVLVQDGYSEGISGFDITNTKLYWNTAFNDDLSGLILANFTDYKNDVEVIYTPKKADISSTVFHPQDRTPLVVYENYIKPTYTILDDRVREDFAIIEKIDRNGMPLIASSSLDFNSWLVVWASDVKSTKYYFYDRLKKQAQYLFTVNEALHEFDGVPMHGLEIPVSDNFTQVCYLSIPKETDVHNTGRPIVPIPMILKVHGGPWSRSSWGFSPLAQYWTNRGYGVLDCNFRISTGYGKKYFNAGFGEWSKKMHQDLLDAVDYVVDKGIADKDRVAIYGGSYGGYAALVGLTYTPNKFACGIDLFGPANVKTLLESVPAYWKPTQSRMHAFIGANPATKAGQDFLKQISPVYKAKQISRPLLVAQGGNDVRVKKAESDQMVQAMLSNDIPVTYLVFPNEGHGFVRPENRLAFHALNEQFLQTCLKGRSQPIKDEIKNSKIIIEQDKFDLISRKS